MVIEYVAGIKTAIEITKALKVATDAIDNAEIKLQIANLMIALADAKMEAAENADTIAELRRQLSTKVAYDFDGKKYFRELENGSKDGPFCATCYDSELKEIRLQNDSNDGDYWHCQVCDNWFG